MRQTGACRGVDVLYKFCGCSSFLRQQGIRDLEHFFARDMHEDYYTQLSTEIYFKSKPKVLGMWGTALTLPTH